MAQNLTFSIVVIVVELLFVASIIAVASKRLRFPFTIGLVLAGLAIGWLSRSFSLLEPLTALRLTPEVVLFVFLPVLLFQSAFTLDTRSLMRNISAIYMLAVPAVLISTAIVGFLLHYLLGLPLWAGLLFGALISATDPVAVISLFREIGAPKRLHLLVEGESLFNDGTSLVVFNIILGMVLAGAFTGSDIASGVLDFFVVSIGGTIVGIAMGVMFAQVIGRIWNVPLVEIALSTILAHSSFMIAEHMLHVSGVIATVVAGLTLGSYGRNKITPGVLGHMESFWEYMAFVCNSLIFLLVGLSVDMDLLAANASAILLGTLVVIAARAVAVYMVFPVVGWLRLTERVSKAFQTVIFWGGLRGALAIVMALSIPESMPLRPFILTLTFGIVLTNLLLNGLTVKPLITLLGLDSYSIRDRLERSQAMMEARKRTMESLLPFSAREGIDTQITLKKKEAYSATLSGLEKELSSLREKAGPEDESDMVLIHCLLLEKGHYMRLFEHGMLSEDNLKELTIDLDHYLDLLKEGIEAFAESPLSMLELLSDSLESIPVLRRLIHFNRAGLTEERYEMERVRLRVTTLVLKEIESLRKHGTLTEAAGQKAARIYNSTRDRAVARMERIWKQSPGHVERAEERLLERYCLTSELESYRDLLANGSISQKIFLEMEGEINLRLRNL